MRRLLTLLWALCLLVLLAACGKQTPPQVPSIPGDPAPEVPADPEEGYTVYDCGGTEIALPTEYMDQLIVETDFPDAKDSWKPLMSVYERASVEAAEEAWGDSMGTGFLFGFLAMDRAGYEQFLYMDAPNMEIIAVEGERYYACTFPTDVQFYRAGGIDMESEDWKDWETLCQLRETVPEDMIRRNELTPYNSAEFFSKSFTWEGNHTYLQFRFSGEYGQEYQTVLVLSQPVRQGEGGIWCVDRWMHEGANPIVYFPDSGLPAAEYYARLQAACDKGEQTELLTPAGAAAAFTRDYFGTEPAEDGLRSLDAEEEARAVADLRLREFVTKIRTGEAVDGMELLECLSRVGEDNWASLGLGMFGLEDDWWPGFLTALENAAIGENQQARDRNIMCFYRTIRDGPSQYVEAVAALLREQREADGAAFAAALDSLSPEERTDLAAALKT